MFKTNCGIVGYPTLRLAGPSSTTYVKKPERLSLATRASGSTTGERADRSHSGLILQDSSALTLHHCQHDRSPIHSLSLLPLLNCEFDLGKTRRSWHRNGGETGYSGMLCIGDWVFDADTRRICGPGGESRLSPKAAGVFHALLETPGRVWSRDALLERVWPDVIVTEEVLTHAIAELRRALGDDRRAPTHIETIYKSGYRLLLAPEPLTAASQQIGSAESLYIECYSMYLEGAALFDRGHKSNTKAAAAKFRQILDLNPEFAPAYAGLAKSLAFLKTYYAPDGGDLEDALAHARTAQRLDPLLAEGYAVEGLIFAINGKFDLARQRFSRALNLNHDSGETHYLLGRACFAELNMQLAAPVLERSAALSPEDYHALMLAGKARQMLGQDDLARRDFALTISRAKPFVDACPDDTRALCADARARFHLGQKALGHDALEKAGLNHEPCYHLACAFARAGESSAALDLLEEVVDFGWNHSRWLDRDPDFQNFRGNPRFERIARSIRGRLC
jgi:DNA-binding winged helix-turn-helix (wHTH) protein